MAYGLLIDTGELADLDGAAYRVMIYKDGYGGTSYVVDYHGWEESYGERGDDTDRELRRSEVVVTVRTASPEAIQAIQAIGRGSRRGEYQLVVLRDGAVHWTGFVLAGFTSTRLDGGIQSLQIVAEDGLLGLDNRLFTDPATGFPFAGHVPIHALFERGLSQIGYPGPLDAGMNIECQGASDPFAVKVPVLPFYSYGDDGKAEAKSWGYVLRQVARLFGLQLVQWQGRYRLLRPQGFYGLTGPYWYNRYQDESVITTGTFVTDINFDTGRWLAGSDEMAGLDPYGRAEATYEFFTKGGLLKNGSFELWDDDGRAYGWTYVGDPTRFWRANRSTYLVYDGDFAQAIRAKLAANYKDPAQATSRIEQRVAFYGADKAQTDLSFTARLYRAQPGSFGFRARAYYALRNTNGQYWDPNGNTWKAAALFAPGSYKQPLAPDVKAQKSYRVLRHFDVGDPGFIVQAINESFFPEPPFTVEVEGEKIAVGAVSQVGLYDTAYEIGDPTNTKELGVVFYELERGVDGTPVTFHERNDLVIATYTERDLVYGTTVNQKVTFTDPVNQEVFLEIYEPVVPTGTTGDVSLLLDSVQVKRRSSESGESSKTWIFADTDVEDGRVYQHSFEIGSGPHGASDGTLRLPSGSAAMNWRVVGDPVWHPITELHAIEHLRGRRRSRRTLRFTTDRPVSGMSPIVPISWEGSRYWPVYWRREHPSGRTEVLAVELRDDGVPPASDVRLGTGTSVVMGGEDAAVYADLAGRIMSGLAQSAATYISSQVSAGTVSALPIAPVDSIFKAGQLVAVVDRISGHSYLCKVAVDYPRYGSALTIEPYDFPEDIEPGSPVIRDAKDALLQLTITDQAMRVALTGEGIATLDETIEAAPRSTIAVRDVVLKLRQGDKLWIKSGEEETAFYLTADAERDAAELQIGDAEGQPVLITALAGDTIYADGVSTRTDFAILRGMIELLVSASRKPSDPIAALAEDLLPDVEYSALPVLWLKYDLEAGDIIGITDDGDNLRSFVVTDFTSAGTEPLIIPVVPITLSEKISAGREFFYPASEMQSGLRIRPDSTSLFSETGIVTQAIMDTVDQIGELAVMHTQTQTLQLKDPLQCDLPGGTTIRIRIRQVINDPRGWRDVDPQYLTVVSRTVAAAGAFKGDTTIPITAGITAQPGSLVYYPMGVVAERVGTAEATIETHTERLDELSAEVVLKAKVSDGVVEKLAAIELQSSIDEAPSVVLRAAHQADAIAELDESIEDATRTLLSIKPLRAPCAQGTRLNLITLDGVIPITVREAITAGTVLPIESQYISKARPGDVIRPDLAYMMAELAVRPDRIQSRVESAEGALAQITQTVSDTEASIESITEILLENGLTSSTNVMQLATQTEALVETSVQWENIGGVYTLRAGPGGSVFKIRADQVQISGLTTFASGYNPATKIEKGEAAADINRGVTLIDGGRIDTDTLVARVLETRGGYIRIDNVYGLTINNSTSYDHRRAILFGPEGDAGRIYAINGGLDGNMLTVEGKDSLFLHGTDYLILEGGGTQIRGNSVDIESYVTGVKIMGKIGFFGTAPKSKPTVTGTKSGISALASLITQLANLGLITDNTS